MCSFNALAKCISFQIRSVTVHSVHGEWTMWSLANILKYWSPEVFLVVRLLHLLNKDSSCSTQVVLSGQTCQTFNFFFISSPIADISTAQQWTLSASNILFSCSISSKLPSPPLSVAVAQGVPIFTALLSCLHHTCHSSGYQLSCRNIGWAGRHLIEMKIQLIVQA